MDNSNYWQNEAWASKTSGRRAAEEARLDARDARKDAERAQLEADREAAEAAMLRQWNDSVESSLKGYKIAAFQRLIVLNEYGSKLGLSEEQIKADLDANLDGGTANAGYLTRQQEENNCRRIDEAILKERAEAQAAAQAEAKRLHESKLSTKIKRFLAGPALS